MDNERLDYRSPEWVAEVLGLDKTTVYRFLNDGTLPAIQLGRKWLVSQRRLEEFMEDQEREQTKRRRVQSLVYTQMEERGLDPNEEVIDHAVARLADRVLEVCDGPFPEGALENGGIWIDACPRCRSTRQPVVWHLELPENEYDPVRKIGDACRVCRYEGGTQREADSPALAAALSAFTAAAADRKEGDAEQPE